MHTFPVFHLNVKEKEREICSNCYTDNSAALSAALPPWWVLVSGNALLLEPTMIVVDGGSSDSNILPLLQNIHENGEGETTMTDLGYCVVYVGYLYFKVFRFQIL